MADTPGYLSNAELAAGVQVQTDQVKQFKDEQTNLYTTSAATASITDAEGVAHTVPSWKSLNEQIEAAAAGQGSGMLGYATKAGLDADLAHADGTMATVTNDPTPANNGAYRKSGASGVGSWILAADRTTVLSADVTSLKTYAEPRKIGRYENLVQRGNLPNGTDDIKLRSSGAFTVEMAPAAMLALGVVKALKYPAGITANRSNYLLHPLRAEDFGRNIAASLLSGGTAGVSASGLRMYASDGSSALGPELATTRTQTTLDGGLTLSRSTAVLHTDTAYPYVAIGFSGFSPTPSAGSPLSNDIFVSGFTAAVVADPINVNLLDYLDFEAWRRRGEDYQLANDVAVNGINDRLSSLEAGAVVNYQPNRWPNGDMADGGTFTYTGSAVVESVAAVPELSDLGIVQAYRPTPPSGGTTASQVRLTGAAATALGFQAGDNILLGSLVYAEDGTSFPAGHANTITVDGTPTVLTPGNQFLQVNEKVRFYYATAVMPEGTLSAVIIGFPSSRFTDVPAVRYHSGFYAAASADALVLPTLETFPRFLGWDGQGTASEFYDQVRSVVSAFDAGEIGASPIAPKIVLGGNDAEAYVEVQREGRLIRRSFKPFPSTSLTASSVFNFSMDSVDGIAIKPMTDDAAPYRVLGTTIGANHGYSMNQITAAGHGKTQADIGSVFSDGSAQHVLVGIVSANALWMTNRAANGAVPVGTLSWISGGTNHADIVGTAAGAIVPMYPPFNNRSIRCYVDGVEVVDRSFKGVYQRSVAFVESYDLLSKADVVASIEANGATGQLTPSGNASATVSITYTFDFEGNCTINTDFLALKDGVPIQDIMFLQSQRMATGVDGDVKYYIPKALPVSWASRTYDYAQIDDTDSSGWPDRLSFTPARCEPEGILCDRVIQLTDHFGFAIGYLPVQDTAPDVRRANASVKAFQLSTESAKIYLSAIDKGVGTLAAGDYFSTIGYRNLLVRPSERTAAYAVRTNGTTYFYADWHAAGVDRVPLPVDLAGREFEVVEKSDNVTVLSKSLTNGLMVSVSDAAGYGYLILKIA